MTYMHGTSYKNETTPIKSRFKAKYIMTIGLCLLSALSLHSIVANKRSNELGVSVGSDVHVKTFMRMDGNGQRLSRFNADLEQSTTFAPLSKLNVSQATTVYHLGWGRPVGRTNNRLSTILHALDIIFDNHGEISNDGSNCSAVVALSAWALSTLQQFFFDSSAEEWNAELERHVPIIAFDRLHQLGMSDATIVDLNATKTYYYGSKRNITKTSVSVFNRRRSLILNKLFRHVSKKNLEQLRLLKAYMENMTATDSRLGLSQSRNGGVKYVAVHLRWLEGQCEKRVGGKLSHDECNMNPTYLKAILRPLNLVGRIPIVVISDMQKKDHLEAIQKDPEIGQHVIVPAWDLELPQESFPASDMMVAAMSDIFFGTRASSMAVMIGLIRVAMGADPQSNYIYVTPRKESEASLGMTRQYEVCGECIFYCNETEHPLSCSGSTIHV